MVLIIGGAYQGKLCFATEQFHMAENDPRIWRGYHLSVLEQLQNSVDPLEDLRNQIPSLKDRVIICDDIFCGVVPEDPTMRLWRETLGRCLVALSQKADEVYRVFCGLGMRLK
ncbi:MAG: bifunctional adenosylcobinamide kinase/adenosylcobinamide-phosphate guanylyltransferase [Clostridiales bacterium]|jgi:adenosyl cobinamide kinase/adenosyl cobinamide phosphate guanylyltransferase|nr:bifunctional adenosylcobinamide kinase/adenosylcobinamide-phosphate guanylyltransferase [Clostridiales bacterium]